MMPDDLKNLTAAQLAEQIEYHNRKYWAEVLGGRRTGDQR